MARAYTKNIGRGITGSIGRFIAILLIIMLGVAFFAGLKQTRASMLATEFEYIESSNLYDLRLLSTIGFEQDDIDELASVDGVEIAAGSVNADFIWVHDGEELVYHAMMLTEGVNDPELIYGRMPESGDECLADSKAFSEDDIGMIITVSDCNDEDTLDTFAYTEYTIVGICRSPLCLDITRGTSSLGNGSVSGFIIMTEDGFDTDYYTEVYIRSTRRYDPYTDEYDDFIEKFSELFEDETERVVFERFLGIVSDAEGEIADAESELADARADGEQELSDAEKELNDALNELLDGEKELMKAEAELSDALIEISDAEKELNGAKEELADALSELESAETELLDAEKELSEAAALLDEAASQIKSDYSSWEDALDYGRQSYEYGVNQLSEAMQEAQAQLDETFAYLTELEEKLNASMPLGVGSSQLASAKEELEAGWEEYYAAVSEFESEKATQAASLEAAKASLDEFEQGINNYYSGLEEYNEASGLLDDSWNEYYSALAEYNDGLSELKDAKAQYEDALAEYNDAVTELSDGWNEYYDGLAEYENAEAEFDKEIADAEAEIADAKAELDDLEEPTVYVFTRSINTGYVTFESDSQIVNNIAKLFPVFFFLIAALVCSTTMTRMIDDERSTIGVLSALGYSRGAILAKYVIYSGSASIAGCLIGYFAGGYLFPFVIMKAYQMLYNIGGFVCVYNHSYLVISMAAALICSVGTTVIACRNALKCPPADLIRPRAPAVGKRVWLERITPIWSHLKFMHKVTARNIFRFKKRMVMMLMGIAGCTALVLTGFGIRDSVTNIGNYQFDDIMTYDLSVTFSDTISQEDIETIYSEYPDSIVSYASSMTYSGDVNANGAYKNAYYVISNDDSFSDVISLHLDGENLTLPTDGGVLISEKLSSMLGVSEGDAITVYTTDGEQAEAVVSGVVENYVFHYVYMTGSTYEEIFGSLYDPAVMMIKLTDDADDYAISAWLLGMDGVTSVSVVNDTRTLIESMMDSLNYVVVLVLISAAALAFVVLFNLGNINISERVREIATIKVIGFKEREADDYIFRENIVLTLMGIVIGLPLGVLLHGFVMSQITVDMVAFKILIKPISYLFTALLVILFTIITDLILRRKISAIDMAESLKSVE